MRACVEHGVKLLFDEVDFEIEELIEAGNDVLVLLREKALGRSSGVPVASSHAALWTLADGKITRLRVFDDRDEAIAAAGLQK